MTRYCILILSSLFSCTAYKFLINSPTFGYSHTNFMGAIADALTEAGHDVTVLMPITGFGEDSTGLKLTKNVIRIETDQRVRDIMRHKTEIVSNMWTMGTSVNEHLQMSEIMAISFTCQCQRVFNDEKLMKMLKEQKFDVGISEVFDICGLGIFEILTIPSTIATLSGTHIDIVAECTGEPAMPSFVPAGLSTRGDRMSFTERFDNLLSLMIGKMFFRRIFDEEIRAFRDKFGPDFKGYDQLIEGVSFVFTNSNPYLDYPRPLLHKTVSIGGITVPVDLNKYELTKKWDDILSERNTTVLVSFGSVAKSIYMPNEYKRTLLKVFESMPETTFVWKYEGDGSTITEQLKNVHLSTWVPQTALLADSRLTVFVTHGGLGSITELAYAGKPAILIPIFAEQTRNAHMFAKHGCGIVLPKHELEHPQKLRDSLHKIFNDSSFSENSRLLSEILHNQPLSPKQLLIKHSEFAARFGRLPNLDPYGRHLSLIQYYLVDVFLTCACVITLVVFVTVKLLRKCLYVREKQD